MAKRYSKQFKAVKKEIKKCLGDIKICLTIADLGNMAGVTDADVKERSKTGREDAISNLNDARNDLSKALKSLDELIATVNKDFE